MNADPLTIAYIALGARETLREAEHARLEHLNGELGYIGSAVHYAARLDELAAPYSEQFTLTFPYDVAEPFGRAVGAFLLNNVAPPVDDLALDLIKEACR